ncbi:MAG: HEPN domain-containing protein [Peptococcaceae bacterium]|nr:HEPN domain-containing protein [Peptococcaceae bacterium]
MPPKKHDLMALAKKAGLISETTKEQRDFMRRLSIYYIETRYPEEKEAMRAKCTRDFTGDILRQTEEVLLWLQEKLK